MIRLIIAQMTKNEKLIFKIFGVISLVGFAMIVVFAFGGGSFNNPTLCEVGGILALVGLFGLLGLFLTLFAKDVNSQLEANKRAKEARFQRLKDKQWCKEHPEEARKIQREYDLEYNPSKVAMEDALERKKYAEEHKVKCPTCGSERVRRIGDWERDASAVFKGISSRKIGKTFECEYCGYTW